MLLTFFIDCQLTEFCLFTRSWELRGLGESAALQPAGEHNEGGNNGTLRSCLCSAPNSRACIHSPFASSPQVQSPFDSGSVYDVMGKRNWEGAV